MAGQSNPWAETDLLSGIKLGCPENGLVMARQFSLQRAGSIYVLHSSPSTFVLQLTVSSRCLSPPVRSCMACFMHTCHTAVCATAERIVRIELSYVQVFGSSQESLRSAECLERGGSVYNDQPRYWESCRRRHVTRTQVEIQIFRCQLALQNASLMSKEALS